MTRTENDLSIIQKTNDLIVWFVPLVNRFLRDHKFSMSWKTLQVDGPTVKFVSTFNPCRGGTVVMDGKSHDCTRGFAVEVEVVSKTKVIERQVETTTFSGGNKMQCEYSPPK